MSERLRRIINCQIENVNEARKLALELNDIEEIRFCDGQLKAFFKILNSVK